MNSKNQAFLDPFTHTYLKKIIIIFWNMMVNPIPTWSGMINILTRQVQNHLYCDYYHFKESDQSQDKCTYTCHVVASFWLNQVLARIFHRTAFLFIIQFT